MSVDTPKRSTNEQSLFSSEPLSLEDEAWVKQEAERLGNMDLFQNFASVALAVHRVQADVKIIRETMAKSTEISDLKKLIEDRLPPKP